MSGAEGFVAVGLASNILQFVDFTTQLCVRIKEICTSSSGLPKELEKQSVQLSCLSGTLKGIAQQPGGPTLAYELLEQCSSEAQDIALLLKRFEVGLDRGRLKTAKLAYQSLRQNKDIEKVRDALSITLQRAMSLK